MKEYTSVYLHTNPKAWYKLRGDADNLVSVMRDTPLKAKSDDRTRAQIKSMKEREKIVYQSYFKGCSTFEDFIKNLRNIFSDKTYEKDKEILRNFTAEKAREKLKGYFGTTYMTPQNFELIVKIKNPNSDEVNVDFSALQNLGKGVTISKRRKAIKLNIGVDEGGIEKIKQSLNAIFNTRFNPNSDYRGGVSKFLNQFNDRFGEDFAIIGGVDNAKSSLKKGYVLVGGTNSPFKYTGEDVTAASEERRSGITNGQFNDIDLGLDQIKQFFLDGGANGMNIQKGSYALQKAFERVWHSNIVGNSLQSAFFMKGGVLNYLVGAMGEYQTALINNYLLQINGSLTNEAISRISETIGQRRQSKVDVTILKNIGIQVKNYNLDIFESARRGVINTTNTPKKFLYTLKYTDALNSGGKDDKTLSTLESFIANYAFSEDYRTLKNVPAFEKKIVEIFETYYAEMYSFAVQSYLNDTVLFYSIAGEYLIPASHILELILTGDVAKVPLKISWPEPYSYDYFYPQGKVKDPPWKRYWEPDENADPPYTQTPEQFKKIDNLLSTISFTTGFQLKDTRRLLTNYRMFD